MFDRRRPNTRLVDRRNVTTVRTFINHLNTANGIVRPIGDVLIGAHANNGGFLFVPMFPGQNGPTTFETLGEALADHDGTADKSIAIPDTLIGHDPGDSFTHSVHIKGCNIGKAPEFLTRMRQACGDHVNVTAPKHFHGLTLAPRVGVFEYMAYEFTVKASTAFQDRGLLIDAFVAEGFERIDPASATGMSPVPNDLWDQWIPKKEAFKRPRKRQVPSQLGQTIGRRRTILTPQDFRINTPSFTWTVTYSSQAVVPGPTDRLEAARKSMLDAPSFDPSGAFPFFRRLRYDSFDDFFLGHTWPESDQIPVVRAQQGGVTVWQLVARGTRVEYTVLVPITEPATGKLFFNAHRNPGSPLADVPPSLVEDDARFFERV